MKAVLLLNGNVPDGRLVRAAASGCSAVLCADGGVRHAIRLGLVPHAVVGDMDSLPRRLPRWPDTAFLCDFDEDRSDFEKALRFALDSGVRELRVAGALGGRTDHCLVNLGLLDRWSKTLRVVLLDHGTAFLAGPGTHALECRPGAVLSIICVSGSAVLTAEGVRYPLRRSRLLRGSRGLSNRTTASRVRVRVHRGRVWIALPSEH